MSVSFAAHVRVNKTSILENETISIAHTFRGFGLLVVVHGLWRSGAVYTMAEARGGRICCLIGAGTQRQKGAEITVALEGHAWAA